MNYVHNKLTRAIEDVGSLDATGNEVYFAANPGEGVATTMFVTGLPRRSSRRSRCGSTTRST